jgi:hypothetical protein
MRLFAIVAALALSAFAATAAGAQTCYSQGNALTCGNGLSAYRYGNAPVFGDGLTERRRNATPIYADWGPAYSGNSLIFNDGRTAYGYDSMIVIVDGRICQRYGPSLVCRRTGRRPRSASIR